MWLGERYTVYFIVEWVLLVTMAVGYIPALRNPSGIFIAVCGSGLTLFCTLPFLSGLQNYEDKVEAHLLEAEALQAEIEAQEGQMTLLDSEDKKSS